MSKPPVNDHWQDWDPYALLGKAPEETLDALAEVSDRGVITFAIGCDEWVTDRLSPYLTDHNEPGTTLKLAGLGYWVQP